MSSSQTPVSIPTAAAMPSTSASSPVLTESGKHYHFYLRKDYPTHGIVPAFYKDLISNAKTKVQILDPYFKKDNASVFNNISSRLDIEIVLIRTLGPSSTDLRDIVNSIDTELLSNANKSGTSVKICAIPKWNSGITTGDLWRFHDRMLIIDEKHCYIVGSSVDYHSVELNAATGIYELYHVADKNLMKQKFNEIKAEADTTSTSIFYTFP